MRSHLTQLSSPMWQPPTSGTQRIPPCQSEMRAAEAVLAYLSVYLGPVTASAAVAGCCHALGREPESLEPQDVPQLLAALRPMLGTFLGNASSGILLRRIEQNLVPS